MYQRNMKIEKSNKRVKNYVFLPSRKIKTMEELNTNKEEEKIKSKKRKRKKKENHKSCFIPI